MGLRSGIFHTKLKKGFLDGAGFVSKVIAVLQIEMLPQSKKHTIV